MGLTYILGPVLTITTIKYLTGFICVGDVCVCVWGGGVCGCVGPTLWMVH